MGINTLPAAGGGGIKLVQRGQATSSGNITITAVDTSKTFVRSFSEGSTGAVATNSTISSHSINEPARTLRGRTVGGSIYLDTTNTNTAWGTLEAATLSVPSVSISGGSTDVTAKQMGVHLLNSTTLVATGACRWEVVEFN